MFGQSQILYQKGLRKLSTFSNCFKQCFFISCRSTQNKEKSCINLTPVLSVEFINIFPKKYFDPSKKYLCRIFYMRHAHNSICKRLLSLFYILKFSIVPGWQITREIPITFDHPPTMHAPSLPQLQGLCHEIFWPVRVHCTKSTPYCTLYSKNKNHS